jgi:hypothetical protein
MSGWKSINGISSIHEQKSWNLLSNDRLTCSVTSWFQEDDYNDTHSDTRSAVTIYAGMFVMCLIGSNLSASRSFTLACQSVAVVSDGKHWVSL